MKFPQVRREVIVRLSRKEMVIEENRTMDITVLSPSAKIISRSIIWQDWSVNGFVIDALKHWKENSACQSIINQTTIWDNLIADPAKYHHLLRDGQIPWYQRFPIGPTDARTTVLQPYLDLAWSCNMTSFTCEWPFSPFLRQLDSLLYVRINPSDAPEKKHCKSEKCQKINAKSKNQYAWKCMKLSLDIDVMSQEFSRLSWIWCLGNWNWNLWKTRRIEKQHRWRSFTSLSEVGGKWNSWDKVRRAKSCLGIVKHDGHDPSRNCIWILLIDAN